ncbi:hypothetical protein BV22DRAFT_868167 [Leucogyrophana mollusca]|uniref:Uncharacterized protein n=1 Tax=Leucogyrophana mollusca TaxID=85980 RepID=A0ACB8B1B4_9AGAM|nr:hypothetical protein BV22DRAFT_868167 [Leucogyrophana mollusca]
MVSAPEGGQTQKLSQLCRSPLWSLFTFAKPSALFHNHAFMTIIQTLSTLWAAFNGLVGADVRSLFTVHCLLPRCHSTRFSPSSHHYYQAVAEPRLFIHEHSSPRQCTPLDSLRLFPAILRFVIRLPPFIHGQILSPSSMYSDWTRLISSVIFSICDSALYLHSPLYFLFSSMYSRLYNQTFLL